MRRHGRMQACHPLHSGATRAGGYPAQRRLVLSAAMLACHGCLQREGEVVHVITDRLESLTDLLRSVGGRDAADQWTLRLGAGLEPGQGNSHIPA